MPRDALKNEEYFDQWIDFLQSRGINHDIGQVKSLKNDEGKAQSADDLVRFSIQIGIMQFGRGDQISSLTASVDQMIEMLELRRETMQGISLPADVLAMYQRLDLGKLYDLFALLAFACALRYDINSISRIVNFAKVLGQDAIIDSVALTLGVGSQNIAPQPKFPKVYNGLHATISASPADRPALLSKFVEEWYKKMKPVYWHNSHQEGEGAYFGYWCFEAAVVAMILNVDDSSFRDHPNYPFALVEHYKATR